MIFLLQFFFSIQYHITVLPIRYFFDYFCIVSVILNSKNAWTQMDTDLPLVQCRHHHHLQSKATPPAVLFLCSSLNGRRGHGIMLIHENVCFIPLIQIDNPVKTQENLQLVLTEALIVTYAARWSHDKLIRRVVQTDVQILWFHAVGATLLHVNVNRAKVKRLEEKGFFFSSVWVSGEATPSSSQIYHHQIFRPPLLMVPGSALGICVATAWKYFAT